MTVHNHRAARQRAIVRKASARWSGSLWKRLPTRLFEPLMISVDKGLCAGSLELHLPDGTIRMLGGRGQGFSAIVHLANWRALARLGTAGSSGWYRAWADRDWSSPDPVVLFALFAANARSLGSAARSSGLVRIISRLKLATRRNSR